MKTQVGDAWEETEARFSTAKAWSRSRFPATEAGEDLLAARQSMEERHAIERRQWETRMAQYLMQQIKPLEGKKESAPPLERKSA